MPPATPLDKWKDRVRGYAQMICDKSNIPLPESFEVPADKFMGTIDMDQEITVAYTVLNKLGVVR